LVTLLQLIVVHVTANAALSETRQGRHEADEPGN
jgi:hypothetical protein